MGPGSSGGRMLCADRSEDLNHGFKLYVGIKKNF